MFKATSLKQIHYFVCLLNILISKKLSKLSLKLMYLFIYCVLFFEPREKMLNVILCCL